MSPASHVSASLRRRVAEAFRRHFGGPPTLIAAAPGRVNLIGEHTDYNDGFVLPAAIGRHTLAAARARDDDRFEIVATDYDDARGAFTVGRELPPEPAPAWIHYVRGMAILLSREGVSLPGADLVIAGDLPRGAGLSSSASLEIAVGLALCALAGTSIDRTRLARLAQRAEHEFAGCPCGIMDQLVSASNAAGSALLIDCRSLETRAVALPDDSAVMIVHSGIARELAGGEYAERRSQCAAVADALGVSALRDVSLDRLEAERASLDATAWRRARHVVTENERTVRAARALEENDLATLGRLMADSHASMRDDFEITLPPIDRLASLLQRTIGARGGARMTGGGFGGAVVAMLPLDAAAEVASAVRAGYRTPGGTPPEILHAPIAPGAHLLDA